MSTTDTPSPRVMLIVPTLERGGAEQMVVELALGLARHGIPCQVCYLDGKGTLAEPIASAGVPVHCLRLPTKAWPAHRRLRRLIRAFRPTVLHAHMVRAAVAAAAADRRVPMLYTEHNVQEMYPLPGRLMYRYFLPRAAHVVAVSPEAAESLIARCRIGHERVTIIPTGVPADRLKADASAEEVRARHGIGAEPLICAIGAVRPSKAYHYLVRAVKMLRDMGSEARALIVGPTDVAAGEAARVQGEIEALGLENIVQLTGEVPNSFDYVSAADVVVLSSVQEGLPRVILEAMVASKPVVATDVGGCSQAVVHGETGLLVPPRNPEALAAAIEEILADPDRAAQMGKAGSQLVHEQFTVEAMVRSHIDLYKRLSQSA